MTTQSPLARGPVAPNHLAQDFTATAVNQLWVADITYIRLEEEFVYLAVILDAYSRRVIGWALERTLESSLTISALRMALDKRGAPPGLIHHSDRGVQYACGNYTALLHATKTQPSMSRNGNPYDNAPQESFFSRLKSELIPDRPAVTRAHARSATFEYIDVFLQPAFAFGLGLSFAARIRGLARYTLTYCPFFPGHNTDLLTY